MAVKRDTKSLITPAQNKCIRLSYIKGQIDKPRKTADSSFVEKEMKL